MQDLVCGIQGARLYRRRYGRKFSERLKHAKQRDYLGLSVIQEYQARKLRAILVAASYSPFWRVKFAAHQVMADSSNPLEELCKLPVLTRMEVQANLASIPPDPKYIKKVTAERLIACHTSGTTGTGLVFSCTTEAEQEQWAIWWRYRESHGLSLKTWCGTFAGRSIVPSRQSTPPYWRVNWPGRQILFSAYHLNDHTARLYLEEIRARKFEWIHGYPSFLALIADYAISLGYCFQDHLKIVTTGAESLLEHQRRLLEMAFGVPVFDHYGQAEGVANISQTHNGELRVDEDFSIVEFLPSVHPHLFSVVGTNLANIAFPLLRYDTQDLVTITGSDSAESWRTVDSIDGRKEDYLVLSDGSRVGRLDHILKDFVDIKEAQFIQDAPGVAHLLYVPLVSSSANNLERRLQSEINERLAGKIKIEFVPVATIPRSSSGKLRFVVSNFNSRFSRSLNVAV